MPNNDNTPKTHNKRGTYRCFDGPSKLMRRSEIRGYAIRYLDNVAKNNGKCKNGFMAGLVQEASSVNIVPQINSRDIENEVARIVTKQRKVSPELSGTAKASTTIDAPLVAGGVEVNEAAVVTTEDYFLFRIGVTVPSTVTHVHIHSSVEWVQAFYNCRSLIEVVLHEGVKTIGQSAFAFCISLPHIIIP
jgi:hypothetical protein